MKAGTNQHLGVQPGVSDPTAVIVSAYNDGGGAFIPMQLNASRYNFTTGSVGIGTTAPTAPLHVVGLPSYASNAAALSGGLTAGAFYRNGDNVCVVH